jgi:hypothetical protein
MLIRCTFFNACSVCNKISELHHDLYGGQYDVLCVEETWLNPRIPNGLLDPENAYNIFRCDRKDAVGGGVCIFVSRKFDVEYTYQ